MNFMQHILSAVIVKLYVNKFKKKKQQKCIKETKRYYFANHFETNQYLNKI